MAKDKKLIIFIPSIEDGGVEKNLYIISEYLSKKINDIIIITYNSDKKNKFNKNIKFINPLLNFLNFKNRYFKYLFCLITLARLVLFDRKYLVLSFQANIFTICICILFGIKVISRSNSSSTGWSKNKIKQIIFKFFFKKTDEIIVNSWDFKKEMDIKYKINTKCILNSFDFKKIKKYSLEPAPRIYKKNKLKIISVGRLTYQKDFMTLLRAIKECKRNDLELAIIGKGVELGNLKKFCLENQLEDKVKFLGYKTNPFKYIRQANIFVLTSVFEGSPNVLIEALFLKKYVISTNCPTGPKEILGNGRYGSLINVGNFMQLSNKINSFKISKKIKMKIQNAKKNLIKYDYSINGNQYYKLIKKYL